MANSILLPDMVHCHDMLAHLLALACADVLVPRQFILSDFGAQFLAGIMRVRALGFEVLSVGSTHGIRCYNFGLRTGTCPTHTKERLSW